MKIKYTITRDVIHPSRGTAQSAGLDLYVPRFTHTFIERLKSLNINYDIRFNRCEALVGPQQRILIPSGIKVNMSHIPGYALIACNKSGVSSKLGLDVLACVIDSDYQGEIHISLVNTGSNLTVISEGMKIVQLLLVPTIIPEMVYTEVEGLYLEESERKDGGFGSTNNK